MPEYRRFIAYFYEYIDGKKQKSAGFAKVELRGGMWRILFRLNGGIFPEPPVQIYGFVRTDGYLLGLPMGTIHTEQQSMEEWAYQAEVPIGRGYRVEDLSGIWIQSSDDRIFLTVWDDEEIDPGKFVLELPWADRKEGSEIPGRDELLNLGTEEQGELRERETGNQGGLSELGNVNRSEASGHGAINRGGPSGEETIGQENLQKKEYAEAEMLRTEAPAGAKALQEGTPAAAEVLQEETPAAIEVLQVGTPAAAEALQEEVPAAAEVLQEETPAAAEVLQEEAVAAAEVLRREASGTVEAAQEHGLAAAEAENKSNVMGSGYQEEREDIRELFRTRPRCHPFQDAEITNCVMLRPCDIVWLQQRGWQVGRSSFLQHGFYQYRHLLLGTTEDGGYIIGVPGIYNPQEKYMAGMFGFDEFKESPARGNHRPFGYWYRRLERRL